MRFMCVGDSMTVGRAGDYTWRYRLWRHLRGHGPHEMAGPWEALYDPARDAPLSHAYAAADFPPSARGHLAGWGRGWQHLAPVIADEVAAHRPHVLLVWLGLIDLGFYTNATQTEPYVRAFVAGARAARGDVRMVLLPVVPNVRAHTDAAFAAEIHAFNLLLAKTVGELHAPGSPILLAPPPAGFDLDRDTHDGTHLSPAGEHRVAGAFADALHEEWGVGGPYPACPS